MSDSVSHRYQGEKGLVAKGKMLPLNSWRGARSGARTHFDKHIPMTFPLT